jgi:hypothetical protein
MNQKIVTLANHLCESLSIGGKFMLPGLTTPELRELLIQVRAYRLAKTVRLSLLAQSPVSLPSLSGKELEAFLSCLKEARQGRLCA